MDMASDVLQPVGEDTARISWNLRKKIAEYQETFSVLERVRPDEDSLPSATLQAVSPLKTRFSCFCLPPVSQAGGGGRARCLYRRRYDLSDPLI